MEQKIRRNAKQWKTLLAEFSESSESEQTFCERHGISVVTLHNRRQRVAREARAAAFVPVTTPRSIQSEQDPIVITLGAVSVRCPASLGIVGIAELAHALHRVE